MRQTETPGYRHEALFYRGDEEFLAGTLPLVREAVDAEAAVLVAIPKAHAAVLREALDGHGDGVDFADMEELGRNPGRIIAAWHDFVRAQPAATPRRSASASRSGPSATRPSSSSATVTRRC